MSNVSDSRISSPASTGGAGNTFERHVAAYWLAQLLVRSIPPIFLESSVVEVSFQTERLGLKTDDFLIVCDQAGERRTLAGQVKRRFSVSSSDEECVKAVTDFWIDFKNGSAFNPLYDRLILVTLRGSNVLLEHFVGLLDCARACTASTEFEKRLQTPGLLHQTSIKYNQQLLAIIGKVEGVPISPADLWAFLRVFHVLSLDLNTSTSQTEAHIVSLLAHTVIDGDGVAVANSSWAALLKLADKAIPDSQTLCREHLPQGLRDRHGPIGGDERRVLAALKDHSEFVFQDIHSTLGSGLHLARVKQTQAVLDALARHQLVILTGPAGSGKSVIGRHVTSILGKDHFVFGFRVEEFAQPHLDATLKAAQIPSNAAALSAILAPQNRKVIAIESVERLLERSTRDAFSDLMTLVRRDESLRVLLTCRDYSVELVRTSFLGYASISHEVISVPLLSDLELREVEYAYPKISVPLANSALRQILGNPYFLDKALQLDWSANKLPETERAFRQLFWKQVIRAEGEVSPATAHLRENTFQAVAVRRARELSPYVAVGDLDAEVIEALKKDSVLTSPTGRTILIATAHDVLEDWAILHWIEDQRDVFAGDINQLAGVIGTHPAIRRSYRKWLAELVDRDLTLAEQLFEGAITNTSVSAQFRDDTIVALLKAPSAPQFFARHQDRFSANANKLLKRVIHLLRVACMKEPEGMEAAGIEWAYSVPDGHAWKTVLHLVCQGLNGFTDTDYPALTGLVEDAARTFGWQSQAIEGEEYVAAIAHWLLERCVGYRSEKLRERILKVIAKVPKGDPARFEAMLRGSNENSERRDWTAERLRDIVFSEPDGQKMAQEVPDVTVTVGALYILASEAELKSTRYGSMPIGVERYFGVREQRSHGHFPASAFRGPWLVLLRYHPHKALSFFHQVFNHCSHRYVNPLDRDPLEPAWRFEITLPDGTTKAQWGNERLWNLYRGTSVGPFLLQSMLMALERWLFEYAEIHPDTLDQLLLQIIAQTESAMISAVVASVATAFPLHAGETLLSLLSSLDFVRLDLARRTSEFHVATSLDLLQSGPVSHKPYETERRQSNGLPHRARHLEDAALALQFGSQASKVQALIDRHKASLASREHQDVETKLRRLALHRMDFRLKTATLVEESTPDPLLPEGSDPVLSQLVQLNSSDPEPDIQEMIDQSAERQDLLNRALAVLNYSNRKFKHETLPSDNPQLWKTFLDDAISVPIGRGTEDDDDELAKGAQGGAGILAAACVRDHWGEMSPTQRHWCVDRICTEVLATADRWANSDRIQRYAMLPDRACAWSLCLLVPKQLPAENRSRVQIAFASGLTHPTTEVRWHTVLGIANNISSFDHEFVTRCVNALALEATIVQREQRANEALPWPQKAKLRQGESARAADIVRSRFWKTNGIPATAYAEFYAEDWIGTETSAYILTILSGDPSHPISASVFTNAAELLVKRWCGHGGAPDSRHEQRNYEAEITLSNRIEHFAMRAADEPAKVVLDPILKAMDHHPREIQAIIEGLTAIEDCAPNTAHYWRLWLLFATAVKSASWIAGLDDEHPWGDEVISAIFLTNYWEKTTRHWRSLEGHAHNVHELFESLPPSWCVLDGYVRFLYHIGEQSLPHSFTRIADKLKCGGARSLLSDQNTIFLLEVLLQRHVYGRPLELKKDKLLRESVLSLLDKLVEAGSAAAYRMRDDFVTPLSR